MEKVEVVIVGGGPGGLSAALVLGRCRRRVLLCDAGKPRNAASHSLHGYLTRDGIAPARFLAQGRKELERYSTVTLRRVTVSDVACREDGFIVRAGKKKIHARKVILATGIVDELPPLSGMRKFYGKGVFHCPYCDGWELRDRAIGAYGRGRHGKGLARLLRQWSRDVTLFTDGATGLSRVDLEDLSRSGVNVRPEKLARLSGRGRLSRVHLANGETLALEGLFFTSRHDQRSSLPARLGCRFVKNVVATGRHSETHVPGLYVVGDPSCDVQFVVVAAAEGAQAAVAINTALVEEDGDASPRMGVKQSPRRKGDHGR